jgi:hypothetical protein
MTVHRAPNRSSKNAMERLFDLTGALASDSAIRRAGDGLPLCDEPTDDSIVNARLLMGCPLRGRSPPVRPARLVLPAARPTCRPTSDRLSERAVCWAHAVTTSPREPISNTRRSSSSLTPLSTRSRYETRFYNSRSTPGRPAISAIAASKNGRAASRVDSRTNAWTLPSPLSQMIRYRLTRQS